MSGTTLPLRAVPSHRYDGTIGAIFSKRAAAIIKCHKDEERIYSTIKIGNIKFRMIHVEGGTFTMEEGSSSHQVSLSSFYVGETPVTQAQWKEVTGKNPSYFKGNQKPVESVSWDDCQEFIKILNQKTGKAFRLLTEAEWEYAARGGKDSKGYEFSGSNIINDVAWYEDNSYKKGKTSPNYGTHTVKQKMPNELGIYDMSGNVWEWCQDWYGNYNQSSQTNPSGPDCGSNRVCRGGSWGNGARRCCTSYRYGYSPDYHHLNIGLRLAISAEDSL